MNIELTDIKIAIFVIGGLELAYGILTVYSGGKPDASLLSTGIAAIAGLAGVEIGKKITPVPVPTSVIMNPEKD